MAASSPRRTRSSSRRSPVTPAIAIENARLHEQVQRLAVVDERERISRDLHDGIIQSLYGVGLSLEEVPELMEDDPDEVVRRVERAIDSLHLTIRDIRNFIFGLRPELLEGTTLLAGLAAIVEELRHNSMIDVELPAEPARARTTPATTANLLGIVNEALSNVARHSGATRATVRSADARQRRPRDRRDRQRPRVRPVDGCDPRPPGPANMRSRAGDDRRRPGVRRRRRGRDRRSASCSRRQTARGGTDD